MNISRETTPVIQDITQINTGDLSKTPEVANFMSYVYGWGFILFIFWTIVVGSVLLWQFSHYFRPSYGHSGGYYQRGKIDDTNYIALGVASIIIGFILTIITLWVYSLSRTTHTA